MKSPLITLLVYIFQAIFSDVLSTNPEPSQRLQDLCNPAIPEDRNVELYGECRTSLNCKQLSRSAECVYKRENYCVCETAGPAEERKWRKKYAEEFSCKRNGGDCVKKWNCKKKRQRMTGFFCRNRDKRCCKPCKGKCRRPNETCDIRRNKCVCKEGYVRLGKECIPESHYDDKCKAKAQCVDMMQKCDSGKCSCEGDAVAVDTNKYKQCVKENAVTQILYTPLEVRIVNKGSGQVMEIEGADTNPGAKIVTGTYTGADNQHWVYDGISVKSKLNDLVMAFDGDSVITKAFDGGLDQQWTINLDFTISSIIGKVLTTLGDSVTVGAEIVVDSPDLSTGELWDVMLQPIV